MQREVQEVLLHWSDNAMLARSPLGHVPAVRRVGAESERPAALREAILQALASARAKASPAQIEACRALELAYVKKTLNRERAAELMNVSRTTFYRLLKQGIEVLADTLMDS